MFLRCNFPPRSVLIIASGDKLNLIDDWLITVMISIFSLIRHVSHITRIGQRMLLHSDSSKKQHLPIYRHSTPTIIALANKNTSPTSGCTACKILWPCPGHLICIAISSHLYQVPISFLSQQCIRNWVYPFQVLSHPDWCQLF